MMKNSRKPLTIMAFGQACDTFSYYGIQTIILLYALHVLHFNSHDSYLLYGLYGIFNYMMPMIGGMIADRGLGTKKTLITGSLLNIIGNGILFSGHVFFLGIATTLIGSGLYKSTSTALIGTTYAYDNKEFAFTWSYLAVNIGGMLAPLIYGISTYAIGWHFAFAISAILLSLSLIGFLCYQRQMIIPITVILSRRKIGIIYFIIFLACLLSGLLLYFNHFANDIIVALLLAMTAYLFLHLHHQPQSIKRQLIAILAISFFAMFYYVAGMQMNTTVTLFIQTYLHTKLPASTFSTLYPLCVLLLAPFFTLLWRYLKKVQRTPQPLTKLSWSLLLAFASMSCLILGAATHAILSSVIISNLLMSAGELILIPTMYTLISDLSPISMKNTLMGGWFLFIGLGTYLSSLLANTLNAIPDYQNNFIKNFAGTAMVTLIVLILFLLFKRKIQRLMRI